MLEQRTEKREEKQETPLGLLDAAWTKTSSPRLTHHETLEGKSNLLSFLKDNAVSPIYNSLAVLPCNAAVNAANACLPAERRLGKLEKAPVPHADFGTPAWFSQSVASGAALAVVFGSAGKLTGVALSKTALAVSESQALVLGGAAVEGLRDAEVGETHLGNMVAGAAMFTAFESGNALCKSLTGWQLQAARGFTGAGAAAVGNLTSSLISRHEMPKELLSSAGVGATMNIVMPQLFGRFARMSETTSPLESSKTKPTYSFEVTPDGKRRFDKVVAAYGAYEGEHLQPELNFTDYGAYRESNYCPSDLVYKVFKVGDTGIELRIVDLPRLLYKRPGPDELVAVLKELPDLRLVKSVLVTDCRHIDEQWLRQRLQDPELRLLSECDTAGNLTLYRPNDAIQMRNSFIREYAGLMKQHLPKEKSLMDCVAEIEPVATMTESGVQRFSSANAWKALGERLLADPLADAFLTANINPIASTIFGSGLKKICEQNPYKPDNLARTESLLKYLSTEVKPLALENLKKNGDRIPTATADEIRDLVI